MDWNGMEWNVIVCIFFLLEGSFAACSTALWPAAGRPLQVLVEEVVLALQKKSTSISGSGVAGLSELSRAMASSSCVACSWCGL